MFDRAVFGVEYLDNGGEFSLVVNRRHSLQPYLHYIFVMACCRGEKALYLNDFYANLAEFFASAILDWDRSDRSVFWTKYLNKYMESDAIANTRSK